MQIPSVGMTDEMKFHPGCFLLWILFTFCAALENATTELSFNSTTNSTSTNAEPDGPTPSPAHPSARPLTTGSGEPDRSSAFWQKSGFPLDGSTSPTPLTTDDEGGTFRTVTPPPGDATSLTTGPMEDQDPQLIGVSTVVQPAPSVQPGPKSEGK